MIIAGTGHRPGRLGGHGRDTFAHLTNFARGKLVVLAPSHVISGMALGWDLALAFAAHMQHIPFTAAVPFDGHGELWSDDWQD
jgi:hypothetical protein